MTGILIVALFAAVALFAVVVLTDSGLRGLSAYRDLSLRIRCDRRYASVMYRVAELERAPLEPAFKVRGTVRGSAPRVMDRRTATKLCVAA